MSVDMISYNGDDDGCMSIIRGAVMMDGEGKLMGVCMDKVIDGEC